jgi:hypothetical protein
VQSKHTAGTECDSDISVELHRRQVDIATTRHEVLRLKRSLETRWSNCRRLTRDHSACREDERTGGVGRPTPAAFRADAQVHVEVSAWSRRHDNEKHTSRAWHERSHSTARTIFLGQRAALHNKLLHHRDDHLPANEVSQRGECGSQPWHLTRDRCV